MQYDYDNETDSRPGGGFKGLAVSIIRQAVWDIRNGNTWQRSTAKRFIRAGWFVELADTIGLNVEATRKRLRCNDCQPDGGRATGAARGLAGLVLM